ncbi:unnamed protein product [Rotaria sp. Silwood2]|nr:unnamed protein product [Rotaria sp. Silwood2]CAF4184415.1 unnamed protein product [Rotaria sp. Silwood2]
MTSYFDEHNCQPLESGEEPNHLLDLDSGISAEFQLKFERIFGHVDGRKQPPAAKHIIGYYMITAGILPSLLIIIFSLLVMRSLKQTRDRVQPKREDQENKQSINIFQKRDRD